MLAIQLFVILVFGIFSNEAARILAIYPCPSVSHQIVFRPLTLELIKRGHHVTVVTTDPMFTKDGAPENLTEIDVHDVLYEVGNKVSIAAVTGLKSDLLKQAYAIKELIVTGSEVVLKTKEFQEILSKNKTLGYDLIFIEAMFIPILGLAHVFKAPAVLISSFGPSVSSYPIMGAPNQPLLYHTLYSQRLYNLTLWEKFNELCNHFRIRFMYYYSERNMDEMLKKILGPEIPPINTLKDYVDMLFVNLHPIWEGNYPVPPNVIHMGGLHQKPPKSLPKDLHQYLDASENGVIYFSLGTNVKTSLMPSDKMAMFTKVFSELPYNVIWKMESDNLPGKSDNIKIFKWLPQADLLRHPNVKLFITQGGLQSTDEAITAGVPLIGVPILGDQWYNTEKYLYHKIGGRLYLEDLTEEELKSTILEVIENKSYRENIQRLRVLMEDQPQKPLERVMWWVDYILRHGGAKHLRAPAANISWVEYLELELVSIICLAFLVVLGTTFLVIRLLISQILKFFSPKDKLKIL